MLGQQRVKPRVTPHVGANLRASPPGLTNLDTGWPPSPSDTDKAPWGSGDLQGPLCPISTSETVTIHK